ncbi:hypothetical protein GCM10027346_36330 [Hymenobacter seoulensis]
MAFPLYETVPAPAPARRLAALGLPLVVNTGFSLKIELLLLKKADDQVLAAFKPYFQALLLSPAGLNGVFIPSANQGEYDYRYVGPGLAPLSVPITGGVQTFPAKHWVTWLDKRVMQAFQASRCTSSMLVELPANPGRPTSFSTASCRPTPSQ